MKIEYSMQQHANNSEFNFNSQKNDTQNTKIFQKI